MIRHGVQGDTTTSSLPFIMYFALLLAISSVRTNEGAAYPEVSFRKRVSHGHLYVTWLVDKNFAQSSIPINYYINFCPKRLNHGIFRCTTSKAVCAAVYSSQTASIQHYPDNITNYLDDSFYEELNDTIESRGPFIESNWDKEALRFTCRIFMHRCMDGQLNPWFAYTINFNGTTKQVLNGPITLSSGDPVKTENVTIQSIQEGCCTFPVVIRWQIMHVCRVDVPSFNIWVTDPDNNTVAQKKFDNYGRKAYHFMAEFRGLAPQKLYMLHIKGFKNPEDEGNTKNASYFNKTFRIPQPKVNVNLDRVVRNGYLRFSWSINNRTYLGNKTVQYILSWCPDSSNPPPFVCKKATTFCHATYGVSGTKSGQGEIRKYAEQLKNFPDFIEVLNTTQQNAPWVTSSWDGTKKLFTCKLWLNPCELGNYPVNIKYQLSFEHGVFTDYRKPVFHYGFINEPSIGLQQRFTSENTLSLTVSWTYERVCVSEASTTSTIWITKETGKQDVYKEDKGRGSSTNQMIFYRNVFQALEAFTVYIIHIQGDNGPEVTKKFRTSEGVPTSSPVLDPLLDEHECVNNKRNLSLRWKLPPKNKRHGIIRYNQVLYWKKSQTDDSEKRTVDLDNSTSHVLVDLECDVEYHVKVRACLQNNTHCSQYSDVQYLSAVQVSRSSSESQGVSDVYLWAIIPLSIFFVIAAFYLCQRFYHKRTRVPLEPFEENTINSGYAPPDDVELTTPGTYCFLINNDDDF